jgi:transposase InsO family protein
VKKTSSAAVAAAAKLAFIEGIGKVAIVISRSLALDAVHSALIEFFNLTGTLLQDSLCRHAVIEALADAMLFEGIPAFIRSDNGPEMVARALRQWLSGLGTKSLYIEPGSPWENGYCESFNGKLRDECLNVEIL